MKLLIILILSINLAYAGNIQPIKKGNPAPFNGFIVDKPQMEHFRKINEQKKLSEAQNLVLEDLKVTQGRVVSFHKKRAERLQNELLRSNIKSYFTNVIFFGLGVLATIVIVRNAPK